MARPDERDRSGEDANDPEMNEKMEREETNLELAREGGYETSAEPTRLEQISEGEAEEHPSSISEEEAEERADSVIGRGLARG